MLRIQHSRQDASFCGHCFLRNGVEAKHMNTAPPRSMLGPLLNFPIANIELANAGWTVEASAVSFKSRLELNFEIAQVVRCVNDEYFPIAITHYH